ncbi:MAG: hypothetical protein ABI627_05575 [Polyangiaceae bacterium]
MSVSIGIAAYVASTYGQTNFFGEHHDCLLADGEADLCMASVAVAAVVGVLARSVQTGPAVASGTVARLVLWLGLSVLLCAAWWKAGVFAAPAVAPAQAFGIIRLFNVWKAWRTELELKRFQ